MVKVLVADDEDYVREMVRIVLAIESWTAVEATNGAQALELARTERPDLVLLDLRFDLDPEPDPDGFAVCRALKADERTRDIPIVMLTALNSDADRATGYAAGATHYLVKPFRPSELLELIRSALPK